MQIKGGKLTSVATKTTQSSSSISSEFGVLRPVSEAELTFSADHHPCSQPVCLEKKFVVFPSEMDLRAHMVAEVG